MGWFNFVGAITLLLIMIPNIIFGVTHKNGFIDIYKNKVVHIAEQLGRFGCFALMVINIPSLYFGFWFENAYTVYITVSAVLIAIYLIGWILCWNRHTIFRTYLLSIVPSVLFIFCGIMLLYYPLIILSVIFAFSHITISLKNAYGIEN